MQSPTPRRSRSFFRRLPALLIGLVAVLSSAPSVSVEIPTQPLALGNDVPNNLVLIPSVEFPTLISQANFDMVNGQDTYLPARTYVGYFDPDKCYEYVYDAVESKRHFNPIAVAANHACAGASKQWSGNFLNWATTQTIDPFRKALTGGYRVKDDETSTWIEKAVNDTNGSTAYFSNKLLASGQSQQAAPIQVSFPMRMRVYSLLAQMYFTNDTGGGDARVTNATSPVAYDPAVHGALTGKNSNGSIDTRVFAISIRVSVCVNAGVVKPESNCVRYGNRWKPEGLIQKYQDKLRYSIFGYMNDTSNNRDGGILRARQKYVGPYSYDPIEGKLQNPLSEWNATTGIQAVNPDPTDASATNSRVGANVVTNSGVINYLNKFGQTTSAPSKGLDNVSELYYAAIRYFKNQDNIPEYSNITGDANTQTDKFPVITDWVNPVQYSCQRNVAVGIGDTYTHRDRNLPGSTLRGGEPTTMPAKVSADTTVNVETALGKVLALEGITSPAANQYFNNAAQFNSGFIAGLAYDSHTKDMQPAMAGMQTLSTYWVDVLPFRVVQPPNQNQYYLAAKYGGFDVPAGFDPYQRTQPLPDAWWTDGDLIGLADAANSKRPRNFFAAYQAEQMVQGLTRAFESAVADRRGASSAVGVNGASVQEGAAIYAPTYFTDWRGELTAYRLDPITRVFLPLWTASNKMPAPAQRKIYANSGGYREFKWSGLDAGDQSSLTSVSFTNAGGEDVVNYLRGERSKESSNGGPFRNRRNTLGDLINSTPMFVGRPSATFYANATFAGGGKAYRDFANANAARKNVVYVGANDGMLHGFDAATGVETYAFVPQAVLKRSGMDGLAGYASPNYQHRFFVDGELTVADVYTQGAWKTVLIGTLGRGGKGVFALDVTDPDNVKFLWELSGSQIPELGNNLGKPWVAQTASGVWKVFLGNGPNGSGARAQLLVLDVATGAATSVDTGEGSDNGLSAARVWDADNNGFVDTAYAGDLKGNLWKFTGFGAGGTPSATRLFQAEADGKGQPITAMPLVGRKPDSLETWVFFGTGSFLSNTDLGNKSVQSWYGIVDTGSVVVRSDLKARSIEFEGKLTRTDGKSVDVRVVAAAADGDMQGKNGWYLDLVSPGPAVRGERMVVPNLFDGSRLLGITRIPNVTDPCNPGGDGFIMEIDPFTGARTSGDAFDADGNGRIDGGDRIAPGAGGDGKVPVSGIGTDGNSPNAGVVIPGNNGNVLPVQNDSGGLEKPESAAFGLGARRISWREVRRDG